MAFGGSVVFVLGGAIGSFLPNQQAPVLPSTDQSADLVKILSSKVVPPYATGTVANINGMNITLISDGDSLTVPMRKDGVVPAPFYQPVNFDSIKSQ